MYKLMICKKNLILLWYFSREFFALIQAMKQLTPKVNHICKLSDQQNFPDHH